MPRILVFQHVAFELLGTLNPLFKSYGFRIRYVNYSRDPEATPTLDGYHGLVVLGGPMGVEDGAEHPHLETEKERILHAIEAGVPVLGICLGAQLIAHALGAQVGPNPRKEIGWYDVSLTEEGRKDPVMRHFAETERIFQWHGDTFEIPPGAVHLARSPDCENQAFRYGTNVYGFQFHLEVDERVIERWLAVPVHRREIESLNGQIDPEAIRAETPDRIARLKRLSDRTFGEFIRLFGNLRRRVEHPHG